MILPTISAFSVLQAKEDYKRNFKKPKIGTKSCLNYLPQIKKDYQLRKKGKRSEPLSIILSHDTFILKNLTEYTHEDTTITYIGSSNYFSQGSDSVSLQTNFQKILLFDVCTVNYDPKDKTWKTYGVKEDATSVSHPDATQHGFSDKILINYAHSNIQAGSYLVYRIKKLNKKRELLPEGFDSLAMPSGYVYFKNYNFKTKIIAPKNIKLKIHQNVPDQGTNIKPLIFSQYTKDNKNVYTFALNETSTVLKEDRRANISTFIPYHHFSTYSSWKQIKKSLLGAFQKKIIAGKNQFTNLLKKVAKFSNTSIDKLKPRNIYYYVVNNFRYVYSHYGHGSHIPRDVRLIIETKYADCKDFSLLIVGLLEAIGVKAHPMLIRTTSTFNIPLDLPSIKFNHMIVAYFDSQKKLQIIDGTAKNYPFGTLHRGLKGRNYVIFSDDKVIKGKTPLSTNDIDKYTNHINLSSNGNASVDLERVGFGYYSKLFVSKLQDSTETLIKKWLSRILPQKSGIVNRYKFKNIDNFKEPKIINVNGNIANWANPIADLIILPKLHTFPFREKIFSLKKRTTPLNIFFPYEVSKSYKIKIPKGYKIRNLPGNLKFSGKFFSLESKYNYLPKEKVISFQTKYKGLVYLIWPNEYDQIKKDFFRIKKHINAQIILEKDKKSKLTIYTSIPPQLFLVEQIGQDLIKAHSLLPSNKTPETFSPSLKQLLPLNKAQIYFKLGHPALTFEQAYLKKIKIHNPTLKIINMYEGVEILHDDPHIWTAPASARQAVKIILRTLKQTDPKHAKLYQQNANQLLKRINQLENDIGQLFSSLATPKTFIIDHPALGYLAKQFNLKQLPIEHEGKEPSPKSLQKLIQYAQHQKIKIVFTQKGFSHKRAKNIAHELKGKTITIDPLDKNWVDNTLFICKKIRSALNIK